MTWSVDGCASAGNRPAAVHGFDPIHHPSHILGEGQITAPQFFQGAHPMLSVVHGMELGSGEARGLSADRRSLLFPSSKRGFFGGAEPHEPANVGFQKIV